MNRNRAVFFQTARGQSLAEYGLVLSLVAVVAIGGLTVLGDNVSNMLSTLATEISNASTGATMAAAALPQGGSAPSNTAGGQCDTGVCGGRQRY